jgi:PAS domain S-box-containing protein
MAKGDPSAQQEKSALLDRWGEIVNELAFVDELLGQGVAAILSAVRDVIVIANGGGIIRFWNGEAIRMFGYTWEEAVGQPVSILMSEDYCSAHMKGFDAASANAHAIVNPKLAVGMGKHKDGSTFPVEVSVSRWRKDGRLYFAAVITRLPHEALGRAQVGSGAGTQGDPA